MLRGRVSGKGKCVMLLMVLMLTTIQLLQQHRLANAAVVDRLQRSTDTVPLPLLRALCCSA